MDRPKCESDYHSPGDSSKMGENVLWIKHFLKGISEGTPNWLWVFAFNALNQALTQWREMKVMEIDNLNEAYWKGREFAQRILGGVKQ